MSTPQFQGNESPTGSARAVCQHGLFYDPGQHIGCVVCRRDAGTPSVTPHSSSWPPAMTGGILSFAGEWTRGEARLWKPYWLGSLLGGVVFKIAAAIATPLGTPAIVVVLIAALAYQLWLQLAIWRCAFNVDWPVWGYLARVGVVLFVAAWALLGVVFAVVV